MYLYSFFHLNLMYSAISADDRKKVIEKSYWPLLDLVKEIDIKAGIEMSALTLELIQNTDSDWVKSFKNLLRHKKCELVGSGYSQIIGPLVPNEILRKNISLGDKIYEEILGVKPTTSLINEQAYSDGIIETYLDEGYKALIVDWDNTAKVTNNFYSKQKNFAARWLAKDGREAKLIWNDSIRFQKFQRFVHGEIALDEFKKILFEDAELLGNSLIYGNDIEIFDFRPGRYMTEAKILYSEWSRIRELYAYLEQQKLHNFIFPGSIAIDEGEFSENIRPRMSSAAYPIPVKKQKKYNVTRWAVTGRNDIWINTICWRLFKKIRDIKNAEKKKSYYKKLLYFWSSDFRTHITTERWQEVQREIILFANLIGVETVWATPKSNIIVRNTLDIISETNRYIIITGKNKTVTLDKLRGGAIEEYIDNTVSDKPLFGRLSHGSLPHIDYSADFYSSNVVIDRLGEHKISDLQGVNFKKGDGQITFDYNFGDITLLKKIYFDRNSDLAVKYVFRGLHSLGKGSVRYSFLTLCMANWNFNRLYFYTHNGGGIEYHACNQNFNHGSSVNSNITSNQLCGLTEGKLGFCDNKKFVELQIDKSEASAVGLVQFEKIGEGCLARLSLSILENDDTSHNFNNDLITSTVILKSGKLKGK